MKELWRWQCATCGNEGLESWDEGRPKNCGGCGESNFKLLKHQENYSVNSDGILGDDWIHPLGEV